MTRREKRLVIVAGAAIYGLCLARYGWAHYLIADDHFGTRGQSIAAEHAELFWRCVVLGLPLAAMAVGFGVRWAVIEPTESPSILWRRLGAAVASLLMIAGILAVVGLMFFQRRYP